MKRKGKILSVVMSVCILTVFFCGCSKKKEVLLPPAVEDTAGDTQEAEAFTDKESADTGDPAKTDSFGSPEGENAAKDIETAPEVSETETASGVSDTETASEVSETETAPEVSETVQNSGGEEGVLQEGQTEIKLYLNGNRLVPDAVPYESGGMAFVPIEEICGYFSRSIACSREDGLLTIVDEEKGSKIVLEAGSDRADVNGTEVKLAAPAALSSGGAVMVELTSFRSLLDADNKYQEDIGAAYITESGLC